MSKWKESRPHDEEGPLPDDKAKPWRVGATKRQDPHRRVEGYFAHSAGGAEGASSPSEEPEKKGRYAMPSKTIERSLRKLRDQIAEDHRATTAQKVAAVKEHLHQSIASHTREPIKEEGIASESDNIKQVRAQLAKEKNSRVEELQKRILARYQRDEGAGLAGRVSRGAPTGGGKGPLAEPEEEENPPKSH